MKENSNYRHGSIPLTRVAINQITTNQWSLREAIPGYAQHGIGAITIWRDKLNELGHRDAVSMLADYGMKVVSLSAARVPLSRDRSAEKGMGDCFRAMDEGSEVGAESLLMLLGPPTGSDSQSVRQLAIERLNLLQERAPQGLQLMIEPLHPGLAAMVSPLNTLKDALDICDQVSKLGVVVDTYNLWWDWDLETQIQRAAGRLKSFHLSDWLQKPLTDIRNDRGMIGDGCIDLGQIANWMHDAGYHGLFEIEIFSQADWWTRNPHDVVEVCVDRMRRCFA